MPRIEVRLPDFQLPDQAVRLTVWLATCGNRVELGEPILEVASGAVAIDLPAPASGVLLERLAAEDDLIKPGAPVAIIETDR